MKKENLFETLGQIDEKFIDEAREKKQNKSKFIKSKLLAVAACFAVVALSVGTFIFTSNDAKIIDSKSKKQNNTINIKLDNVYLNKIKSKTSFDNSYVFIEDSKEVKWTKEQFEKYFGKNLTPAYIPNGLKPSSLNYNTTVAFDKKGNIIYDDVGLEFYDGYYKDGSPKLSNNISACYGFSLTASKLGIIKDYSDFESEVKETDILGTKVTFGYCSVDYGPYDKKTHEPAGYYDMYTAEFKHDGIEYQIKTEQLDKTEIIKIVTSIISGEKNITVK